MEKLDQILERFVAIGDDTEGKVLGASLIVTNKDGTLYEGAAGRIGLPMDSAPFATNSSGWIASLTKIITATSLMQIVEKRLIQLDDDVRPLIPELASAQILEGFDGDKPILVKSNSPITLRHLLTHTSGMGYDVADPDLSKWSQAIGRTASSLDQSREGWTTPLKFPPGTSWYYGTSLDWAGFVLEAVAGKNLGAYMAENIFEPLGMSDTTFHRPRLAEKLAGRIIECVHRESHGELVSRSYGVPEGPPQDSGGSGLFSTPHDFASFLGALVGAGEGRGPLLRKETVDEMFRPQLDKGQKERLHELLKAVLPFPEDTPVNHGISGVLNTEDVEGKRKKNSLTWIGMSNCQWWIDRESGIAAVLFVNLLPPSDECVLKLYDELEKAVYGDLLVS